MSAKTNNKKNLNEAFMKRCETRWNYEKEIVSLQDEMDTALANLRYSKLVWFSRFRFVFKVTYLYFII